MSGEAAVAAAELYDAHGAIAREIAHAVDELRAALETATLGELGPLLTDALRRCERVHGVAAGMRERWS